VALRGPLADEVYHYDLDNQQDIVTAPSRLTVWRSSTLARPRPAHPRGWDLSETAYAVRAVDPRDQGLKFPTELRGLRWVVEDGVASPRFDPLHGRPCEDGPIVIERRGGYPPWVRAGIGSVVSAKGGWVAIVGSHFVECFL